MKVLGLRCSKYQSILPSPLDGTAPNGQSVKLLYTIQFENINIISTHITSPSWYEVDVAVRVVAPLDCSSSVSSDGGEGCAED